MVPYTNCTGAVVLLKDNNLEENGYFKLFTFISITMVYF